MKDLLQLTGGSRDHDRIEAEEQTAKRTHDGAS
jgi:hypothetical protein